MTSVIRKPWKKFMVAEFTDGLEVVPTKWGKGEEECLFPRTTSAQKMIKAARAMETPKKSWVSHKIKKVLAYSNTYDGGLEKMKIGFYQSDGFISTEYDRSDESEEDTGISKYPAVPVLEVPQPTSKPAQEAPLSSPPVNTDSTQHIVETPTSAPVCTASAQQIVETPTSAPVRTSKQKLVGTPSTLDLAQFLRNAQFDRFTLDAIQVAQNEITSKLDVILKKLGEQGKENVAPDIPELPRFPISSEEDLRELEDRLQSKEVRSHMIKELKKFGGGSISEVVRRIISYAITDELGEKYSFMGLKGKGSFCRLTLCGLINDVTRVHVPEATNKDVGKYIAAWLRHAKERDGKRKNKSACE